MSLALQTGQVARDVNQASIQWGWKTWLHLGNKRSVSWSSNSFKHTAHSSSPLPILRPLTAEYARIGKVSTTSWDRPRRLGLSGVEDTSGLTVLEAVAARNYVHCLGSGIYHETLS